jgi:hypothetical protein
MWLKGPGGIKVEKKPWAQVEAQYAFVAEMARMRERVRGPGNLERFDYWLNTYRFMAAMAEAGCMRGELDAAMSAVAAEADPVKQRPLAVKALSVRTRLARLWERMISLQVAAADTPGELGTLANLEQHNRTFLHFLDAHDAALAKALQAALPDSVEPNREYAGPARIIVPTARTLASRGECLSLRIILLDGRPARSASLFYRPMGRGPYREIPVNRVARAVYAAAIPALTDDIEYFVRAEMAGGQELVWPPTAPSIAQTVVVR